MMVNEIGLKRFLDWNKEGIGEHTYNLARMCQYKLKNEDSVITMSKKVAFIFRRYRYKIKKLEKGYLIARRASNGD